MVSLEVLIAIAKTNYSFAPKEDIEARDVEAKTVWQHRSKRTRDRQPAWWLAERFHMARGDRESASLREQPLTRKIDVHNKYVQVDLDKETEVAEVRVASDTETKPAGNPTLKRKRKEFRLADVRKWA